MREWDKLQIACELADKYNKNTGVSIGIEQSIGFGTSPVYAYKLHIGDDSHYTNNIDTVIEFLKTPQPQKYKVGDFVWVRQDNNKPEHKKIIWIIFEDGEWRYGIASAATGFEYTVTENELFLDKKSLINAQIKYWVGFKNKENKQC